MTALLGVARELLDREDAAFVGTWPRAVAFVTRQALEDAVDEVWRRRGIALTAADARAQLLCLESYLGDADLAASCRYAWHALSRACHHHPYELAPTATELERWINVVSSLTDRLALDKGERPNG